MPLRLRHGLGLADPFREMRGLRDEMTRFQRDYGRRPGAHRISGTSEFPPINLWEGEHDILVIAEIPGIAPDALEIAVHDGTLTLKGDLIADPEAGDVAHHRRERHYGSFSRAIGLPFDVDPDKVQADCRDGILRIYLPRPEARKAKRIKISQS